MSVLLTEIKTTYPSWRKEPERYRYWVYYVTRPLSYYLAWLLIKLGFSANAVTYLGLALGLGSCACFILGGYLKMVLGAILLIGYLVCDATDGNVARVTNTSTKFGAFLDGLTSLVVETSVPISLGVGLYLTTGNIVFLILGFSWAIMQLIRDLVGGYFSRVYSEETWDFIKPTNKGRWEKIYWIGENLIWSETLLLLIFALASALHIFIISFTIITTYSLFTVVGRALVMGRKRS